MTKGLTTKIRCSSSHPRAGALAVMVASALAASAAAPTSATAAASPTPAAFALTAVGASGAMLLHGTAGQVLHGAVRVRNVSRQTITVILQPADIKNAGNGNADYVTTALSHTGRWLHLAAATVRLAPHASRRIAFTVSIPAGTIGASHYAGIVAINAADLAPGGARKGAKGTSFTFYRINRQALPLTIRLPGPLTRSLALRFAKLIVAPVGASLHLGLRVRRQRADRGSAAQPARAARLTHHLHLRLDARSAVPHHQPELRRTLARPPHTRQLPRARHDPPARAQRQSTSTRPSSSPVRTPLSSSVKRLPLPARRQTGCPAGYRSR